MTFQIILINGKIIECEGDGYYFDNGTYYIQENGETVGEFQRNNIAGFWCTSEEE